MEDYEEFEEILYDWDVHNGPAIYSQLLYSVVLEEWADDHAPVSYTHLTARAGGLYKVTVDATGHITNVEAVTKADITALGIPGQDTNTTYTNFKAATASVAGGSGLVPAPPAGAQTKYMCGDGTWQIPPNTTYGPATATSNGLMTLSLIHI